MTKKKCALCENLQQIKVLYPATVTKGQVGAKLYSARRPMDNLHFQINKCERCGLLFSSPIFSVAQIRTFYKKSGCTYGELVPFAAETYGALFASCKSLLPKQPKVLEIGCGTGFFLERLKQQGINQVWGVEPGKAMVETAPAWLRPRIKRGFFKRGMFRKGSFDLVACFHTLDHVLDPSMVVKAMFEVLKPGGLAVTLVHDTAGLSVKLFGEKSAIFDVEHIYLFNQKTLRKLFEKFGFVTRDVINVTNRYPLSYWLTMSGLPQRLKRGSLRLVKWVGWDTTPLSLAAGNIAIVATKSTHGN